jgi:hypothetical protein
MTYLRLGDSSRYIKKEIDKIRIVEVDGEKIRDELEIEYTMGGHHYRYPEMPESEIWIEDDINKKLDRVATIEHELTERLAQKFLGLSYDHAHELASSVEKIFRTFCEKKSSKSNE